MKRLIFAIVVCALAASNVHVEAQTSEQGRQTVRFNFDWKFQKGSVDEGFGQFYDDRDWETVQLPHDVSIYGPFVRDGSDRANGWRPRSEGWYRKTFDLPADARAKKVHIEFEGVYRDARVWINGRYLGRHLNGYLGFEHDLTPYVDWDGANVIAVHYDNRTPGTSRWYTGEGIYRDVWLKIVDPLHVPLHGTYVTTPIITEQSAVVEMQTEVVNHYAENKTVRIVTEIQDAEKKVVCSATAMAPLSINETYIFRQEMEVPHPNLWDVENPYLYRAITRVFDSSGEKDTYETRFGIREVRLTPDKGLLLNGKKVFAQGGDIHHDLGCLGSATFRRGYEKRLLALKEMGCNSVRLSHNPHASMVLDLCDEMGVLVIDELYDKWNSQYYGGEASIADMWRTDLEHFIRRDRNHPSIYIWSMGNEVLKQHGKWDSKFETPADAADYGVGLLKQMVDFTHRMEPTRKVTCALYPLRETGLKEWESWDNYEQFMASSPPPMAFHMDVVSWNYTENFFDLDHRNYPQMMFIASESATSLQLGNRKVSWLEIDPTYLIGHYYWSAWDYLGESYWPAKTWARAFFDLGERMNPLGALYRSFYDAEPFVEIWVYEQDEEKLEQWNGHFHHVLHGKRWNWYLMDDHWNWQGNERVKLTTFTNCDQVELFVNERSLGVKKLADFENQLIDWDIPYQSGTIRAVARNGQTIVADHSLKTAGEPVKVLLEPDRETIKADGLDLAYINVRIVDDSGITVTDADRPIRFDVAGAGVNAGVASGDYYSDEPFQGTQRSTQAGHCLLVIRANREKGTVTVTATTADLPSSQCVIAVN